MGVETDCNALFCPRCADDPVKQHLYACQEVGGCKSLKAKMNPRLLDKDKKVPEPCSLYCNDCAPSCCVCNIRLCKRGRKKVKWTRDFCVDACWEGGGQCDKEGCRAHFEKCAVCACPVLPGCVTEIFSPPSNFRATCGKKTCVGWGV